MHKLCDTSGDSEEDLKARLEEIAGEQKVFVLGLGNIDRADDGAGVRVALALKQLFPSYSYSEHDGVEGTVLDISERKEPLTVFFVDAADLKMKAGSIKIVMKGDIKETEITTHRVAVALMASVLEKKDKKSAVICIQPRTLRFGGDMSEEVKRSIDEVVRILASIMEPRSVET